MDKTQQIKTYTITNTLSEIALLEKHLDDLILNKNCKEYCGDIDSNTSFCIDCTIKHSLTVIGLASEGQKYVDEYFQDFVDLFYLANKAYDFFTKDDFEKKIDFVKDLRDKFRNWRKKIVAKNIFLSAKNRGKKKKSSHVHFR